MVNLAKVRLTHLQHCAKDDARPGQESAAAVRDCPDRDGAGDDAAGVIAYMMPMDRRAFLLAALGAITVTRRAAAEPIGLAALSQYLDTFTTAEAQFSQVNPDGTLSTGRVWIRRPGRMRFEYDGPSGDLVIASGGSVAVIDRKSNQPPTQFPISRTPLSLILAPQVDLTRAQMVVDHRAEGNTTVVVAQDPERPEYGQLRLVFTDNPIELRQWKVTDDAGRETTVILGEMRTGMSLPGRLFDVAQAATRTER